MAPRKGDTLETAEAGSSQARPRNPNLIPSREESPSAENKRQVSQDKAKVFKEGAERYMAASKLKHEIEYLCETLALYDDLMELQNRKFPCSTASYRDNLHSIFPSIFSSDLC